MVERWADMTAGTACLAVRNAELLTGWLPAAAEDAKPLLHPVVVFGPALVVVSW